MRIDIRCDGNREIASGHVRRCLALADAFDRQGAAVRLIVADSESAALAEGCGWPIVVLQTDYRRPDGEIALLIGELKQNRTDFLLIDSYFVSQSYLERLRGIVRTGYIDDLHAFSYPVDLLLQYACLGPLAEGVRGHAGKCLAGTMFAPLRNAFGSENVRMPCRETVQRILVTTGGADARHMALRIAREFCDSQEPVFEDVTLSLVVGSLSDDYQALETLAGKDQRIEVLQNVEDMAALMKSSDLAITAAGTTLFELCAVGVPAAAFVFGPDQEGVMETLQGVVFDAGSARDAAGAESSAHAALQWAALTGRPENAEKRRMLSERMRNVTDGKGAMRVTVAMWEYLRNLK